MRLNIKCTKAVLLCKINFALQRLCFPFAVSVLIDKDRSVYQENEPGGHHVGGDDKGAPGGEDEKGGGQIHLE